MRSQHVRMQGELLVDQTPDGPPHTLRTSLQPHGRIRLAAIARQGVGIENWLVEERENTEHKPEMYLACDRTTFAPIDCAKCPGLVILSADKDDSLRCENGLLDCNCHIVGPKMLLQLVTIVNSQWLVKEGLGSLPCPAVVHG